MLLKIILIILAIIVVIVIVPCMKMSSRWSRIEEQKEIDKFCKEFDCQVVRKNGLIVDVIKNSEVAD